MQTTESDAGSTPAGQVEQIRRRLGDGCQAAQAWYEGHASAVFAMVWLLFVVWALLASSGKPIWYDEWDTMLSASSPTVHDVIAALVKPIDATPPLHPILVHFSLAVFGSSPLAARLPSIIGFSLLMVCIYSFVSRRLTPAFGVLAVLLLLSTTATEYAWEARAYGVLLGWLGLAMVAYQRRVQGGGAAAVAVLWAIMFLIPTTHYYGVLVVAAFFAAELARTIDRRRIDWPVILGIVVAPLAAVILILGVIRAQSAPLKHFHSQGSLTAFFHGYELYKVPSWEFCLALAAMAVAGWLARGRGEGEAESQPKFTVAELTLAFALLSLPFVGSFAAKITKAYVSRYFIPTVAGFAVVGAFGAASVRRRSAPVALLLSAVTLLGVVVQVYGAYHHRTDPQPMGHLAAALRTTQLPVILDDAHDWVLARELNPESANRFFYLAEPQFAIKLRGTDTDDTVLRAINDLHRDPQIQTLDAMSRISSEWFVVPGSIGWVMSCLTRMQLDMHLMNLAAPGSDGAVTGYRVRLPGQPVTWCEAPAGASQ